MKQFLLIGLACAAVMTAADANAQNGGGVTLYSSGHFKGASMTLSAPREHITPPFVARSIKLPEGSSWEFCNGNTYTGCKQLDHSVAAAILDVRSARPAVPAIVTGSVGPVRGGSAVASSVAAVAELADRSLRGLASEFFVAPRQNRSRIAVRPGTAEAMRRVAISFCRSAGWQTSPYARLQSAGRAYYLADVLCADNGR
jgi:hypothetical protein